MGRCFYRCKRLFIKNIDMKRLFITILVLSPLFVLSQAQRIVSVNKIKTDFVTSNDSNEVELTGNFEVTGAITNPGAQDLADPDTVWSHRNGSLFKTATSSPSTLTGNLGDDVIGIDTINVKYINSPDDTLELLNNVKIGKILALSSSETVSLSTDDSLTVTANIMYVEGNGGAVTGCGLSDGLFNGQLLTIICSHATNSVRFDDGKNIELDGGNDVVLTQWQTLELFFSTVADAWIMTSKSSN